MSTVTITEAPFLSATSTDQPQAQTWDSDWILDQEVVVFGSPADAGEGGRLAVREHAEALRILRDS